MFKFITSDDSWFCIRREVKFYFGANGKTKAESDTLLVDLKEAVMKVVRMFNEI